MSAVERETITVSRYIGFVKFDKGKYQERRVFFPSHNLDIGEMGDIIPIEEHLLTPQEERAHNRWLNQVDKKTGKCVFKILEELVEVSPKDFERVQQEANGAFDRIRQEIDAKTVTSVKIPAICAAAVERLYNASINKTNPKEQIDNLIHQMVVMIWDISG